MSEPSKGKARMLTTVDEDLLAWIDANIKSKRFASRSHAVEYAFTYLRQKSDGVLRTTSWTDSCRLNEKGDVCIPFMLSAEDACKLSFPQYPPVDEPIELEGWTRSPGFENCDGYNFPYVYRRREGKFVLKIATDPSQAILKTAVIKIGIDEDVCQDDFESGIYDLHQRIWRHGSTLGLPTSNYDIVSFAAALVEHAKRLNEI